MYYRQIWITLGICYIAFIVVASLSRTPDVNLHISYADKIIHFFIYFILVGWFAQLYQKPYSRWLILIGAVLLGMLIEYLQGMTAYRSFDYADEVANTIGAVCAYLLAKTRLDRLLTHFDQKLHSIMSA